MANEARLEWIPRPGRKAGKLGGNPFHKGLYDKAIKFRLVLNTANLPALPATYNVEQAVGVTDTNMDGNDTYGDCVEAMSAHMERVFQKVQTGIEPTFPTQAIVAQYLAESGGDNGLDILSHMTFWRDTGLLLDGVHRDQIDEFVTLDLANDKELLYCIFLLDGAACGLQVPQSAIDQFNNGQPWDIVPDDGGNQGGHGVAMLAFDGAYYYCLTWGALQAMTPAFYHKYFDAAIGVVDSKDKWVNPATDPINVPALEHYAQEITGGGTMTTKTFAGTLMDVSVTPAVPVPNQPVSIPMTNPDKSAGPTLSATTGADGSYSVQQDLPDGTGYQAAMVFAGVQIGNDIYDPTNSPVVTFDVGPTPPPPPPAPVHHQTAGTLTVT